MNDLFLAIDIGNTTISIGVFQNESIVVRSDVLTSICKNNFSKFLQALNDLNLEKNSISCGLICSVVPDLTRQIKMICDDYFEISLDIIDSKINYEISNDIDNPLELGQDLLADIVSAKHYYKAPLIIVDLGTINKFLVINENETFIGASFLPGTVASFKAMGDSASLLPTLKEFEIFSSPIGKNTIDTMKSGIFYGTISAVEGMANRISQKYGHNFLKVLTGGYSTIFHKSLDDFILDKDLTLKGIYLIWKGYR